MVYQNGGHYDIPSHYRVHKPGAWLPADRRIHHQFLDDVTKHLEKSEPVALTPAVQALKETIENSARIYMYFVQMFEEIPCKHPHWNDPMGYKQVRDYEHMLQVLNYIVTRAPAWSEAAVGTGLIGVPMCALLDHPMATPSGYAAFLDPGVNKALKVVLNEWGKYLQTPESTSVLGDHKLGWFGEIAMHDLMEVGNAPYNTSMKFEDMYICDPQAKHMGFKSWDAFFTRQIKYSARPLAGPYDDDIIANPCESQVYNIERNVKLRDRFFAKGQPYSVLDMLDHDPLSSEFAGGTVYQAFLSALSYHRWHSPISGTVRRAFVVDGTYFSEPLFECTASDPSGGAIGTKDIIKESQGYLSALATRAVFVIEADNPRIGLLAFVGVGMDEVSTCENTVKEGQHVRKGDELGMFHYGGSSCCVIFKRGVQLEDMARMGSTVNVPVRGKLARVSNETCWDSLQICLNIKH